MLPRADLNGTRPVAYVEAPTPVGSGGDARQEVYHRLAQLAIGQKLDVEVLKRLEDGTFLVKLAGTSTRMTLPVGTKAGDSLSMTLVEHEPRPTFQLDQESAALAGDTRTRLSSGARMINQVLQFAQQGNASTTVVGKVPVLPSPTTGAPQVAAALQDAVDVSGLFYESHLAQWTEGSRNLASLLREPQAQLPTPPAAQKPTGSTDSVLLRHLMQQWSVSGRPLTELVQELQARSGNLLRPSAEALAHPHAAAAYLQDLATQWTEGGRSVLDLMLRPGETRAGAAPETTLPLNQLDQQSAQMINSQLHALEQQRFAWHGELWPGQPMEWEVSRDAPQTEDEDTQHQSWRSTIRLELPNLGVVAATIQLAGEKVNVMVKTETEIGAAALRAHGGELVQGLRDAGSQLESLIVNQDGQT